MSDLSNAEVHVCAHIRNHCGLPVYVCEHTRSYPNSK